MFGKLWDKITGFFGGGGFGGGGGGSRGGGGTTTSRPKVSTSKGGAIYKPKPAQPSKPQQSSGGGGGGYGGGYGGGGYVGGGASTGAPAPKPPKEFTYDDLSAGKKKLYDSYGFYTPDWKKLDNAHQGVLQSYQGQRDAFKAQTDAGKKDLLTQYNRLLGEAAEGRKSSAKEFASARRDIQEQEFLADRQNRARASASGMADSGASQLGALQNRMASGDAMSEVADGFYEKDKAIQKELTTANDNYNSATVQLDNTLKSALADIMSAEKQTDAQYKQSIEQAKRQVKIDSNAVQKAKHDLLATEHQMNMQLQQFERSKFESDRAYNLSVQQMNQQQANANRAFSAQQANLQRQLDASKDQGMTRNQAIQGILDHQMNNVNADASYKYFNALGYGDLFVEQTGYNPAGAIAEAQGGKKKRGSFLGGQLSQNLNNFNFT